MERERLVISKDSVMADDEDSEMDEVVQSKVIVKQSYEDTQEEKCKINLKFSARCKIMHNRCMSCAFTCKSTLEGGSETIMADRPALTTIWNQDIQVSKHKFISN
jgi:hypothetical protein